MYTWNGQRLGESPTVPTQRKRDELAATSAPPTTAYKMPI